MLIQYVILSGPVCNVTIDGALLSVSAGTLGGSLSAPPSLEAPLFCWYSLRAPPGHRVEVQLHRLIHVGSSMNGTAWVAIKFSENWGALKMVSLWKMQGDRKRRRWMKYYTIETTLEERLHYYQDDAGRKTKQTRRRWKKNYTIETTLKERLLYPDFTLV